jgi:redox-sensitive bicupin YhaK (pirin superfamily)
MAISTAKRVKEVFRAKEERWVGDGFPTRNVVSYHRIAHEISPFLNIDLIGPSDFDKSSERLGAGELPYKGLEIVTLMYDGEIEHIDGSGNVSTLGDGDVQWVTAGSGLVLEENHSEEFDERGGRLEMVRIWVNLPAIHKHLPPRFQVFEFGGLPRVDLPNEAGYVRAIAGELNGVAGPAETRSPLALMDMRLKQGKQIVLPFPSNWTVMILVVDGKVGVENGQSIDSGEVVLFDHEGSEVEIQAHLNTTAVLLAGEPILEPVSVQEGFAMNTPEDVIDAMQQYRTGKFGAIQTEQEVRDEQEENE